MTSSPWQKEDMGEGLPRRSGVYNWVLKSLQQQQLRSPIVEPEDPCGDKDFSGTVQLGEGRVYRGG